MERGASDGAGTGKDPGMTPAFIACATITAISAFISLGFSIAAIRRQTGEARTTAWYATVRSAALAAVSVVPFLTGATPWLLAAASAMVIVQAGDALIGVSLRNALETYGPAGTALVNLAALLWLLQAAG